MRRDKPFNRAAIWAISGALFICGFSPLSTPSSAQSYPIRVYTEADGLSNSTVYDIVEGPEGRLWFATRGGISVYDGAAWQRLSLEHGVPPSGFLRLAVAKDGAILGLNVSKPGVFVGRDGEWSALGLAEGQSWALDDFTDLALLDGEAPALGTKRGLHVRRGKGWRWLDLGEVRSLAAWQGALFVATERGLFRLGGVDGEAQPMPLEIDVHGLGVDGESLWLAGRRQLGRLSADGRFELLRDDLPDLDKRPGMVRLERDGRGGVYLADRQSLVHVSAELETTTFAVRHGLAANGATSMMLGPGGVLWAASERGVSKLISRRFASFDKTHGLFDSEVSAILERQAEDGVLIFGHNGGLTELVHGRPARTAAIAKSPDATARVMDLVERAGDLWIVTSDSGLWHLPGSELSRMRFIGGGLYPPGRFPKERRRTPGQGFAASAGGADLPRALAAAVIDSAGQLWVGGTGLARLEGDRFERIEPPLGGISIRRLAAGPGGEVYAATSRHGLLTWKDGRWSVASRADGTMPSLFTVGLWRGQVWAGADEGLFYLEDGHLVPAPKPRVERPVYGLLAGPGGRLWIGTDYGVIRFDGEESRWLGPSDGLAGGETNRGGLLADREGNVWIGTAAGASRFDERYDEAAGPPEPRIDGVLAAGRFDPLEAPITLPWHGNQLTFRFRAVAFIDEERIDFSGRLIGFDEDFQPPARAVGRRMHYTNLPPGDYRFEVRARHRVAWGDAPWSQVVSSPVIRIARPWWTTPYFYAASAVVILLVAGTLVLQLTERRSRRQLESLVGERTRELVAANERLQGEVEERRATENRLRRARLAAEEASLAKSRFLAVMSHEIRTPMTGVLGIVDLLERDSLEDRQRERVDTLRRAGEALLAILDDILDYSRLESGRLELRREPLSIRYLFEEVFTLFSPQAAEKGIELRLWADDSVPLRVLGDISRLRQVVVNLAGNAVKFTHRGEVKLEAGWRRGKLTLIVEDTGIGIAEDHQKALFEPFQQVDASAHRRYGGTGLGLAISRRLVTAMGGEIELSSRIGEGSIFTVRLPAERCLEPEEPAPAAEPQPSAEKAPLRILVAEDNPMVQRLTLEMLEALGYIADLAENGAEVLEALEQDHYDMILMDVQMPVLDGLEATRRICARWPEERPHIIAVTAHALRGDRETCLDAGMDDYLSKPVTLQALEAKITSWTAHRSEPSTVETPER